MWWPGLFIGEALFFSWVSWCIIFVGVLIEWFALNREKLASPKRMIIACLVGNTSSFVVGTILGAATMVLWHYFADEILGGTFHPINWAATLIIMLGLSIGLETLVVRLILKIPVERFLPIIAIGNLLVYAYLVVTGIMETTVVFGQLPPSFGY